MAKKKKDSIWAHFGLGGEDEEEKPTNTPTIEDLQKQLADMTATLENERKAGADRSLALYQQSNEQTSPSKVYEPDFSKLPDPTIDQAEYAKQLAAELRKQAQSMHEIQLQETRKKASKNSAADALWSNFRSTYSDYAKDEDRTEFAATRVINKLKARNVDLEKYMTVEQDKFFTDVVKTFDDIFGKPGDKGSKETEDEEDEGEADRTAGIFGGLETGGRPDAGTKTEAGDMIKDLHDLQRKSGFF